MLYHLPIDHLRIPKNASSKERTIAPYVCLRSTVVDRLRHSQSAKASFVPYRQIEMPAAVLHTLSVSIHTYIQQEQEGLL